MNYREEPFYTSRLDLPTPVIATSPGVGIDFGSTLVKIAYRSNEDFKNGVPIKGKRSSTVYLASFRIRQLDSVVEFIKKNVDLTRTEGQKYTKIFVTGNGGQSFKKRLKYECSILIDVIWETESTTAAFLALSRYLCKDDIIFEMEDNIELRPNLEEQRLNSSRIQTKKLNDKRGGINPSFLQAPANANALPITLPCILLSAGSAFFPYLIHEDSRISFNDHVHPGGLTFLSMAYQLTGVKEWDKIMELVTDFEEEEKSGNGHLKETVPDNTSDIHEANSSKQVLHDLYEQACQNMLKIAILNAKACRAKQIFFIGNFINNGYARKKIIDLKQKYDADMKNLKGQLPEQKIYFLKEGGMLGALGAFLYQDLH